MELKSNCCYAPIWQPDPATGHGHCQECGDTCTPVKEENDMSKTKIAVSYRLEPELKEEIEAAAAALGVSQSDVVKMAIRVYLDMPHMKSILNTRADASKKTKDPNAKSAGSHTYK